MTSYTALRQIGIQGDKFVLNGRPYQLRMVLDQGYWPETGLTAPDDDALRRDVELAKAMGFNGVRKHQKIEDPRYLVLGGHAGAAGVGGDAERVPVHAGLDRAADAGVDGGRSAGYQPSVHRGMGAVQ